MATSKTDFERYVEMANTLGLPKEEILKFCREQAAIERQERKEEREAREKEKQLQIEREEREKQLQIEREEKEKQLQIEREKREKQLQIEREEREKQIEREEREKQLQFERDREERESRLKAEIEMERMRTEVRKAELAAEASRSRTDVRTDDEEIRGVRCNYKNFKMPVFDENSTDFEAYCRRFELTATAYKVPVEFWGIELAKCLQGNALEVYQRLSDEDCCNYEALKNALRKRYKLTEGGFRMRFRRSRCEANEPLKEFACRLMKYFENWVKMSDCEETYEGVKTLMIKDQLFYTLPKEVQTHIKESGKQSLDDMVRNATNYMEAHGMDNVEGAKRKTNGGSGGNYHAGKAGTLKTEGGEQKTNNFQWKRENQSARKPVGSGQNYNRVTRQNNEGGAGNYNPRFTCYSCGEVGHKSYQCPHRRTEAVEKVAAVSVMTQHQCTDRMRNVVNDTDTRRECVDDDKCEQTHDKCLHEVSSEGEVQLVCGCKIPVLAAVSSHNTECTEQCNKISRGPVSTATVNGVIVDCLRDTGASLDLVRESLVTNQNKTGRKVTCMLIDGVCKVYPIVRVHVESDWYTGYMEAACVKELIYPLIIGNNRLKVAAEQDEAYEVEDETVEEAIEVSDDSTDNDTEVVDAVAAVQTREMKAREEKKVELLVAPETELKAIKVTTQQFREMQKTDEDLQTYWEQSRNHTEEEYGKATYVEINNLLYRKYKPNRIDTEDVLQLMVPKPLRPQVIEYAHSSLLGAHLGIGKTINRVTSEFWWSGVNDQVKRYCWSCDTCQKSAKKGRGVTKAPMQSLPIVGKPFDMIYVDIVGPLNVTESNNRFILTVVDMATKFPEAVSLKKCDSVSVAEALFEIFKNFGVSKRIHSDRGPCFVSSLAKQFYQMFGIQLSTSARYWPRGNSVCERYNKTLKSVLARLASEKPSQWDRYLAPLVYALRTTPHASTGYTPFELMLGRNGNTHLGLLRELWTGGVEAPEVQSTYEYVLDLKSRIEQTCILAQESMSKIHEKNKKYYDKGAKNRELKIGSEVLVLLPDTTNRLAVRWKGPYRVVEKKGPVDYRVEIRDGLQKVYHINMLKEYVRRPQEWWTPVEQSNANAETVEDKTVEQRIDEPQEIAAVACLIDETDTEDGEVQQIKEDHRMDLYNTIQKETYRDVKINEELSEEDREKLLKLVEEFQDIFSDVPKVTNLVQHKIVLRTSEPIRSKPYRLPYHLTEAVDKEIDELLKLGFIEPSNGTGYASPIVVVQKRGGKEIRLCVNYKKLNSNTVFDPQPMAEIDDIMVKLAGSKWYSSTDCCKGYYAVRMEEDSKEYTSFVCHRGVFRFKVMPFGLMNSAASYNRLMAKVLDGAQSMDSFVDDVICYDGEFEMHLNSLKDLFTRVRKANLVLKPSKTNLGYQKIEFLGHVVTENSLETLDRNVEKILNIQKPTSKKQLRGLIGMVNFYAKFIPNRAQLLKPLTKLTQKGANVEQDWGSEQDQSLTEIKRIMNSKPVLKLANLDQEFIIQSDASGYAIGATLMQKENGVNRPVMYASRQLLPREQKYTTGEKECLAVVFAVDKFQRYLKGKEFVIESDHRPLQVLNEVSSTNPRVMRWALLLQGYKFRLNYIPGRDNLIADYLSRQSH